MLYGGHIQLGRDLRRQTNLRARSGVQAVTRSQAAAKFAAWPHVDPRDGEKQGRAEIPKNCCTACSSRRANSAVVVGKFRAEDG